MRLSSIDRLRGMVMVVMVLDHARDFYFGVRVDPTDLAETTPILFFTRWITHFCAPGFVLLAGAAAYLYGRKRSARERAWFLLSRGLWLVVLEVTIVRLGWVPEPFYRFTLLQVIWAIGWSMVLIAPLSLLPARALAALGAIMVVSHNLLDGVHSDSFLWAVIHERRLFEPFEGHLVRVSYPLVPWVGVMMLGLGLGELLTKERRGRWLLGIGIATAVAFVLVRAWNVYGDPAPWAAQRQAWQSIASFLDCTKYPPSLSYLLMTLGPILIALWALERFALPRAIGSSLETIGRVPLFFYVAHLWLLRFTSIGFALARWGVAGTLGLPPEGHAGSPEWPLWATYLVWVAVIVLLYPACRWFASLKARRSHDLWWLRYL